MMRCHVEESNDREPTNLGLAESSDHSNPSFGAAVWVWCRIAMLSFGGPAGQIAVMHRILVDEKRWISESRFLHALNYCMLLPGPEAQQLAIYIGWLLHRTIGGVLAGTLFVLPGFVSILLLSIFYAGFNDMSVVQGLFYGLKPAVIAVVVAAVIRIGSRSLTNRILVLIAASAFVMIFFFGVPFPLIVLAAGLCGYFGGAIWPAGFRVNAGHESKAGAAEGAAVDAVEESNSRTRPGVWTTVRTASVWLAVWLVPVMGITLFFGPDSVYTQEAFFFSKAAVVTFGGAYSVLAYIAQECVTTYQWLAPGEMLDGIGMAETTPGPLIQVVQFVGFMGAYRNPGELHPMVAAVLGSIITTWVTFAPCFLWIFTGAPYIEYLRGNQRLNAALSAITAAVVGVILNLSIWFSLNTLFGSITEQHYYGVRLMIPDWTTIDPAAALISIAAFVAIFRFKTDLIVTLISSVVVGFFYYLLFRS